MVKVNNENIKKHTKELEKHNDILPLILITYIRNHKYINHLKDKKLWYGEVQDKLFKRREKIQFMNTEELIDFEDKELKSWIKKNKEYEDILTE